jgi:hypothetical protein
MVLTIDKMRNVLIAIILLSCVSVSGQEQADSLFAEIPVTKKKKHQKAETVQGDTIAQIQEEDPCSKGIIEARNNESHSDFSLIYNDGAPYSDLMIQILYEDYHIRVVAFSKEHMDYCRCYTEEMNGLLSKHFGFSVFARAEEKAKAVDAAKENDQPADTIFSPAP